MNDATPPTQITDTLTSTIEAGSRQGWMLTLKQVREFVGMTADWPEDRVIRGELCDPDSDQGEDEYTTLRDVCYLTAAWERADERMVDEPDHSMLKEDARNAAAAEDAAIAERIRTLSGTSGNPTARFSIGPNVDRPEHATWRVLFDTLDDAYQTFVSMARGKDPLLGKDGPTGIFRRAVSPNDVWVYQAKTTQAAYNEGTES